jgi:hypothetical protein
MNPNGTRQTEEGIQLEVEFASATS